MSTKVVLLDIEGTTSSIAYVYDVLFPYVRNALPDYLALHWNDADIQHACALIGVETGLPRGEMTTEKVLAAVFAMMDGDVKSTGLKELQGSVSRAGYESGTLRAHFYPDVPAALARWTAAGLRCCVYSSGSIGAQKNFYRYADAGDLSHYISANFDTTTGPKRESASYAAIANALKTPADDIVFCSDVLAELDAAKAAGMQTVLVIRAGNKPALETHSHKTIRSFDGLNF